MSTRLRLLAEPRDGGAIITATILALNRSFVDAGVPPIRYGEWRIVRLLGRAVGKLRLQRNLVRLPGTTYVAVLMWPNDGRFFPFAYFGNVVPYIFDCWPPDYPRWESLFRRNRTRIAFFSARGSAEHFGRRFPAMSAYWLPEACDPLDYDASKPLAERTIDVLELGRKYKPFHDPVRAMLPDAGLRHLFSPDGTRTPIFDGAAALRAGLGDTRISVCFPKSMTHPGDGSRGPGTSGLETVTLRYFEGMASKCVIVGHCPAELEEIFGYNPIVQYDPSDPAGQVREILGSIEQYQARVDGNEQRLHEVGTWDTRVDAMLTILEEHDCVRPSADARDPEAAEAGTAR